MHIYIPMTEDERTRRAGLTLSERLLEEAQVERDRARQYEHCTWSGDRHPSEHHFDRARLLEQAALAAKMQEKRVMKRKVKSSKKRATAPKTTA